MSHVSKDMSMNFTFMYQDVFNGVVDALQRVGFTLKSKNLSTGYIVASTGISLLSLGEDICIFIQKIDEGNSSVSIHSELKTALSFAAGNRHEENFQKIINALGFYLQRNNCKSDTYTSNLSKEFSKRKITDTFFYNFRSEYQAVLQAEGISRQKINMFMSLYDEVMIFVMGVSKSKFGSQELSWLLTDDKVLFQAYIYVYHMSLRLLSEHIEEPKLSEVMAPFICVAMSYTSYYKNKGHKATLSSVLNNTDTIMKSFTFDLWEYGSKSTDEVPRLFLGNVFKIWKNNEETFDEVVKIFEYIETKGKDPFVYFEDYMARIPNVIENILIKGLG